jgi:hypothetical protein
LNSSFVTKKKGEEIIGKKILLFERPEPLEPILHPLGWRILKSLSTESKYPAQLAKEFNLYRQRIYYHTRRLEKGGFIQTSREEDIKGGLAKYYTASYPAFGIELPFGEEKLRNQRIMDNKLEAFCRPIISSGNFDGYIVVGSPEPHGPYKATARDGHYGVQLALFLGQYCQTPKDFIVKLDVDVKTEKAEDNNMILIGGPGTNLLTNTVNQKLPIRFNEKNYWSGLSDEKGHIFAYDRDGIIAKIQNPLNPSKYIIVLAGNRHIGTKSAVIAFINSWSLLLKNYNEEDNWAIAVRGFDMDGDGKIDSAEILI